MKKYISVLITLICSLAASAQMPVDSITDENPYFLLMGEADRAIADGNWQEAIDRLNDVLSVDRNNPSNALVYYNLGVCYGCLGADSLALDSYDRSLGLAPNMVTTLVGRGRQLLAMSRDREAYGEFSRAIEIDSLSTDARYYHGMMSLYGGFREEAERDFDVLKSLTPHARRTAVALSALYSITGREREAVPYLKELIDADPQPEYYASLAGCYLELGELSEASALIHTALEKYPDDAEIYYYRAWLNRDNYRLDDAKADARRAISLGASPTKVKALFQNL